jgi:hypothetical protein
MKYLCILIIVAAVGCSTTRHESSGQLIDPVTEEPPNLIIKGAE